MILLLLNMAGFVKAAAACACIAAGSASLLSQRTKKTPTKTRIIGAGIDSNPLQRLKSATELLSCVSPHSGMSQEVKATIVQACRNAIGTDLVGLFTIDPLTAHIACESTEQVGEMLKASFLDLFENEVTQRERRHAWVLPDLATMQLAKEDARVSIMSAGVRAIMACPIRAEAFANGALVAFFREPLLRVEEPRLVMETVAAQASTMLSYAIAIEQSSYLLDDLAGENQELSLQAMVDGLTGLANHRQFQQTLSKLCNVTGSALNRPFCLVMMDVDHFKMYNDNYGHQAGDAVLRLVAKAMSADLRHCDFAARYGGEEFALIFQGVTKQDASRAADRIRRSIAQQAYEQGRVTVSMGIAEFPADGSTPPILINNADKALYHAKITGRNRVYVYGTVDQSLPNVDDPSIPSKTILVVEPSEECCAQLVRQSLPSSRCTVAEATNVDEAVEILRSRVFDIALVSIQSLPNSDVKSLGVLSAIHPHMPIVLISDDILEVEGCEALRRGASDILFKPYDAADLPVVIERNLERQRIELQELAEKSGSIMLQAIEALVAAIDSRDHCAAGHSSNVTELALAISDYLDLSNEQRYALELAAKLHDIGKVALPDSVLNKHSQLTDDEWQAMRQHPVLGSRIVGAISELAYVSNIIRHHHERLDGSGYPDGLRGTAIPLLSRIIAVADTYDAMTNQRAHRDKLTPAQAIDELARGAGSWYSEDVVGALQTHLTEKGKVAEELHS